MMRRMFRGLVRRAQEGDTEALEALANLEAFARESMTVGLAASHVNNGGRYTFGELSQVLHTSRQAVRQRVDRAAATVAPGVREWLLATSARPAGRSSA